MSALNVLLKEPVIPFIRKIEEKDTRKVNLQHMVTMNIIVGGVPQGHREKRAVTLTSDIEVLIRLITSFLEACNPDALDLPDGMVHAEFRKCVEDVALDACDALVANVAARTRPNFLTLTENTIQ